MNQLSQKIEAVLFFEARPVSYLQLRKIFDTSEEEVKSALSELNHNLSDHGLSVIQSTDAVELATDPRMSSLIEGLRKQDIYGELGKAALECLTIVLYQNPLSRADIDYIRGVNSQYSIRRLLTRGLIEKQTSSEHAKRILYVPTTKLLSHLGISDLKDLPEYEKVRNELEIKNDAG